MTMGEPPTKPAPSNFRQQDVARAIRAAKGSGLEPAGIEPGASKEWDAEIANLKAKAPKAKRRGAP
jgi:hypothetical protein